MPPPVVSPGHPQLLAAIHSEIAARGPMTFARFMEMALYHPRWGYYTARTAVARIGRGGDFFTNVSVGALFGRLLALLFAEVWGPLHNFFLPVHLLRFLTMIVYGLINYWSY